MATAVTPSENITAGQIGKISELVGANLRKSGLKSEPVQLVLENQGEAMTNEILAVVRKYVDAVSSLISRLVTVDRTRGPKDALKATGRTMYVDDNVVKTMPKGEATEVEVFFFNLGRYIKVADLEKEFDLRGFKPADPYELAAVNEADPAFADEHPNGTQWKDSKGDFCYATFYRGGGGRRLRVSHDDAWDVRWWFAGVRK
jgi:hypothetical protein